MTGPHIELRRVRFNWVKERYSDGYGMREGIRLTRCVDGPLVSSMIEGSDLHVPLFDIDADVYVVPSKTAGHHHVYLSTPTTWRRYKRALKAMSKAGMVDPHWVQQTIIDRVAVLRMVAQ